MLCPFRKNQKVEQKYKDFHGNGMYFDIQEYFPECEKDNCPYYAFNQTDCKDICLKVRNDLNDLLKEFK